MSLLAMNSLYNGKGKWSVPMVHRKKTLTSSAARIIIFRKENLNHLIVCFTTCTLFFHVRFLFSICLPGVICGTYVTRINVVSWHFARQTLWSRRLLVYFACLRSHVFRAYKCCVVTLRAADTLVASLACLLRLFTFSRISCLLQLWIKTSDLDYSIWATPK